MTAWEKFLLEKQTFNELVKTFAQHFWTEKFISDFTRSQINAVHFDTLSSVIPFKYIYTLSMSRLQIVLNPERQRHYITHRTSSRRGQVTTFVNTVMKLQFPQYAENFWLVTQLPAVHEEMYCTKLSLF